MAIDINATYPGRVNAPDANYPTGSIKNETVPGSSDDGTPLDEAWGNDFEGFKQALIKSSGLALSGTSETATASDLLKAVAQQAMGRAVNFDDTGAANAYIAELRADQQGPGAVFDGLVIKFNAVNANTAASTVDISDLLGQAPGTTVISIKLPGGTTDPAAGDIAAGEEVTLIYRTSPGVHAELKLPETGIGTGQTWQDVTISRASGVTYTNTTGKPIMVGVSVIDDGSSSQFNATVAGLVILDHGNLNISEEAVMSFIVPDGATYSVAFATNTLVLWTELR